MNQDDNRLDARVADFHLRRGSLDRDEYKAYLDALPDEADEAVETETRFSNNYETRHYGQQPADD